MLAQAQADIQPPQRIGIFSERLQGRLLVTKSHHSAQFHKLFNAALMADTCADERDLFSFDQLLKLFDWKHDPLSLYLFWQSRCIGRRFMYHSHFIIVRLQRKCK